MTKLMKNIWKVSLFINIWKKLWKNNLRSACRIRWQNDTDTEEYLYFWPCFKNNLINDFQNFLKTRFDLKEVLLIPLFFISHTVAPRPILVHSQWSSFSHLMLLNQAKHSVEIKLVTSFLFAFGSCKLNFFSGRHYHAYAYLGTLWV